MKGIYTVSQQICGLPGTGYPILHSCPVSSATDTLTHHYYYLPVLRPTNKSSLIATGARSHCKTPRWTLERSIAIFHRFRNDILSFSLIIYFIIISFFFSFEIIFTENRRLLCQDDDAGYICISCGETWGGRASEAEKDTLEILRHNEEPVGSCVDRNSHVIGTWYTPLCHRKIVRWGRGLFDGVGYRRFHIGIFITFSLLPISLLDIEYRSINRLWFL